ncbi:MAG TPA: Fur family transcriptional regulator [Acetobacteraceae bacterium]|nr:Fur family transcriptional regulator [Acetobacteraceae bacterium]
MGFSPHTETLLHRAGEICAARGARLTDLRREVLGLILDAGGPAGAYDLLGRLRGSRGGAAPPTVYRALDFLVEQGLVHKLERLSAFVGCVAQAQEHAAQFLICRSCGRVTELEDHQLEHALADAAERLGFTVGKATIEAEGQCAACASGAGAAARA